MGKLRNYFLNHYPRTDFHELNQDWMISMLYDMINQVENFVEMNSVKYADPIQWDITRQYEKNTIVVDPITGTAYISSKPVPMGVALSRTEYWNVIFDIGRFITLAAQNFANSYEAVLTTTATMETDKDKWIVWNSILYRAKNDIHVGDRYVVDGNIEKYTVEMFFDELTHLIAEETEARIEADTALHNEIVDESVDRENADNTLQGNIDTVQGNLDVEATVRQNADNTLQDNINAEATVRQNADTAIDNKIGNLNNLHTTNKTSIVNAINSIVATIEDVDYVTPQDFGAIGDGFTDDTDAVQAAISDGRPVKFVSDYAITQIHFTYGLSTRFLDGGEHYLNSLDATKTPVEFCGGGALIYRLGIRQHAQIGEPPALYWYSENGGASNFNIFYDLRFDYCYHCIKYGDGTEIAQSENRIIGMFTYACSQFITMHGRLLQLWIDQAVLNASQFPSEGNMPAMINVTRGSILFIDNSTIENVGYEQQAGIVSTGECYINNCVLEIAGINLSCFREANGVDNDGLISMTNSRAFQGGGAKDFLEIALNGTCIIQNCYILKLTPAIFFFYHNTDGCRLTFDNVKCEGGLLPVGNFPNMELSINASTFNNCKMLNHGYFHLDNSVVPSPSGEAGIWDNTIYGNYQAHIADIRSSVYVGTTNNYLLLAGGTVGDYKGAFIYTAPNHQFGILRNYMTEYNSTITGGVCFT